MPSITTYVVEDDHWIKYAGQSLIRARQAVSGSGRISVWLDDYWLGLIGCDNNWLYKVFQDSAERAEKYRLDTQ